MAQLEPYKGGFYLWNYLPSVPAAVIFILLFLAATAAISWRMYKTRTWFCVPFAVGGFCEFIGYCARASAHNKTGKLMPFVIQNVFILVAPALFAASIYMSLGRIIRSVRGEKYSIIRVDILTKTFVAGDVLSFVVQGSAAGLMATGDNAKMGEQIVIGGLMIQIIMFGLFAVTAILFELRLRQHAKPTNGLGLAWKRGLNMLYGVSALIMVRSIFRVIEYAMGQDGYPLRHEWTLYIFDSVLMFFVMALFYVWYPDGIQPQSFENVMLDT
ncbi:RTA1 like protein [Zopfia rhizophila CBS 207.26]|uniref:RTA1 like protein n=1 Tax=Zopfia rhizophila CBS 207.26 TaxID=1314779 RepID=A0A6A6EUW7_9PEZI|nr:RTA1 like protein [Zopfia rhizophila CBS 207.26]